MFRELRSLHDPRLEAKRLVGGSIALGTLFLSGMIAWAFTPLDVEGPVANSELSMAPPTTEAVRVSKSVIEQALFDIDLWALPKRAGVASEASTAQQRRQEIPLKVTLVGILDGEKERQAILYDPDEDRLHLVAIGQKLKRYEVKAIGDDVVTMVAGRARKDLRMRRADQ